MFNLGKKLGFAALLAFSATSANAVVLDTFDYGQDFAVSFATTNGSLVNNSLDTTNSTATSTLIQDFNAFYGDVNYTVNGFDSGFSMANENGSLILGNTTRGVSEVELFYGQLIESNGSVSLLDDPKPFSDFGNYFYYDLQVLNVGNLATNDLDVKITVSSGALGQSKTEYSVTETYTNNINSLSRQFLSFNEFYNQGASATFFDEVVSVTVAFDVGNAVDFELTEFGVIPEPATLAIFGLGLMGFAASRKRKA